MVVSLPDALPRLLDGLVRLAASMRLLVSILAQAGFGYKRLYTCVRTQKTRPSDAAGTPVGLPTGAHRLARTQDPYGSPAATPGARHRLSDAGRDTSVPPPVTVLA
jgi:hypothetical protein